MPEFTPTFDLNTVPERYRAQVAAMIPSPEVATAYVHRHITGMLDFDLFDIAADMGHNILMPGPSGAGKTTAAMAYAAHHGLPFVSVEFQGGFDAASVLGTTRAGADGLPEWQDGEATLAYRYGGVVSKDEVSFAPPRATAAFHGALDVRGSLYLADKGERVRRHQSTVVFASHNPGYTGTARLNEAFLNRFAFPIEWGYDNEVEQTIVGEYSGTLLELVRRMRSEAAIRTDIGTNSMIEFMDISERTSARVAASMFVGKFDAAEQAIVERAMEAELANIASELEVTYA